MSNKALKLTTECDGAIYVNPSYIVKVESATYVGVTWSSDTFAPRTLNGSRVFLTNNLIIYFVKESPEYIASSIGVVE